MSENFDISLKELLEAGCHFGHQVRRWNPKMKPYIWQAKEDVHIFDLVQTQKLLKEASLQIKELSKNGKTVVFIGTKRQAQAIIKDECLKNEIPYVATRWMGGTITNWSQIQKSIEKLLEMKEKKKKGEYSKYTKKENVLIDREIVRLTRFFGGLTALKKEPDALFIIDTKREIAAVKEARQKGITIFAIADSNADPDIIDYVVPANDDAVRSIKLIVGLMAKAYSEGKKLAEKKEQSK